MISFLKGLLIEKELTRTVIDVNNIGFELLIPMSTYDRLPAVGQPVEILVYLHVRQDIMQLFGFFTPEEKALFVMLISSVSGIGPKLGLSILSAMPVRTFSHAVVNKDIKVLSRINGVGKRSAERLVVELKDKIHDLSHGPSESVVATSAPATAMKAVEDAISGLITLGFKAESARKTVSQIAAGLPESDIQVNILIQRSLMVLNS